MNSRQEEQNHTNLVIETHILESRLWWWNLIPRQGDCFRLELQAVLHSVSSVYYFVSQKWRQTLSQHNTHVIIITKPLHVLTHILDGVLSRCFLDYKRNAKYKINKLSRNLVSMVTVWFCSQEKRYHPWFCLKKEKTKHCLCFDNSVTDVGNERENNTGPVP